MGGCVALILAGGSGTRLGAEIPKQYLGLAGKPVLRRTVEAFLAHPSVDSVQVVIGPSDESLYEEATGGLDLPRPVVGGATRQESGRLGLEHLSANPPEFVLIHDAARPFVDAGTIDRVIAALATGPAALPGVPVADTLKRAAGEPLRVGDTVDRDGLWRAQTPQGFRYGAILAAHRAAAGDALTDDAAVAEHAGLAIALVPGNEDNFKITTRDDLARAERMTGNAMGDFRTGNGFDVHAFGEGDHVVLCGVRIDHGSGLEGHSDADVAMHAVTDALLGAIAEGDIGSHFPPSDPKWRGAASRLFLEHAGRLVAGRGGAISNVDVTVVCEAPRIGPHRDAMRASLAAILGIDVGRVGVKATTTEKLGFTGRREGIAAQATATVRLP
ncbi:MAG: bifunctional 2-C-methyl-D-erythritol 4-phosphate cytidylyltransferase/2-C-methyl-D-erythritol 2,4-cyclodiphosphate synthase [Rhodospirillaceae bacterium]